MLRSLATPADVAQILSNPLPTQPRQDNKLWPYTDHDRVTVKSAYHRLRGGRDAPTEHKQSWDKIIDHLECSVENEYTTEYQDIYVEAPNKFVTCDGKPEQERDGGIAVLPNVWDGGGC